MTPASSLWLQLWVPIGLARQSIKRDSLPLQATLSSSTGPVPWPYPALVIGVAAVMYYTKQNNSSNKKINNRFLTPWRKP